MPPRAKNASQSRFRSKAVFTTDRAPQAGWRRRGPSRARFPTREREALARPCTSDARSSSQVSSRSGSSLARSSVSTIRPRGANWAKESRVFGEHDAIVDAEVQELDRGGAAHGPAVLHALRVRLESAEPCDPLLRPTDSVLRWRSPSPSSPPRSAGTGSIRTRRLNRETCRASRSSWPWPSGSTAWSGVAKCGATRTWPVSAT